MLKVMEPSLDPWQHKALESLCTLKHGVFLVITKGNSDRVSEDVPRPRNLTGRLFLDKGFLSSSPLFVT